MTQGDGLIVSIHSAQIIMISSLLVISYTLIFFIFVEGLALNEKGLAATPRSVMWNSPAGSTHMVGRSHTPFPVVVVAFLDRSVAVFSLMESMKKRNPPFASRALEQDPDYQRFDARDRAFSRALLMTTERRSGQISKMIQSCMRPQTKVRRPSFLVLKQGRPDP